MPIARYRSRVLEPALTSSRSRNKVRLIFGARQTGKTMLLRRLLPEGRHVFYDLQDSRLRRQFESNPGSFRQELDALDRRITHIGVDEIQKVPELLEEVQYAHDRDPRRFQFFLTGSSARRLRHGSANLLPGRCHQYSLFPVVRPEETSEPRALDLHWRAAGVPFPERSLERRLVLGSLPGIQLERSDVAAATLEAYVENYLEEEVRREGLVRNLGPFMNFLALAAVESGRQINVTRLSQECGVPASTVRQYYQVLVDTFVGYWMPPYGTPGRKRLLTTPRFLFFDLGVRNAAARMSLGARLPADLAPALLEQWVGLELLHRAGYAGRDHAVTFWRTTSGAEVDYIWQSPREHVPIEVKWTENPQPKDARHVEAFLNLNPRTARRGMVVCRVPRLRQLTERTVGIPWDAL